jgi:hypothetical protein
MDCVGLTPAEVSDLRGRLARMKRPAARLILESLADALDLKVVEKPRVLHVDRADDDSIGDVDPSDPREAAYRVQFDEDAAAGIIPIPPDASEDDIFEIAGRIAAQGDWTKLHLDGPPPPRDYGAEPIRGLGKIVQPKPKGRSEPSLLFRDNPVGVPVRGMTIAEAQAEFAAKRAERERVAALIQPPRRPRSAPR